MRAGGCAQLAETQKTAHLRDAVRLAGVNCDSCQPDFALTASHTVPFAVTRTGS
jgi:hypothetical protein